MQLKQWINLSTFLDLNPIMRTFGGHLKQLVNEHYSKLEILIDSDEIIKKHTIETLQEA